MAIQPSESIEVTHLNTRNAAVTRQAGVGALLGLAWGTALRAWMVILALEFGQSPSFTWRGTFTGILIPAGMLGGILSVNTWAEDSSRRRRWTILSPLLLVLGAAVATDDYIRRLVKTGIGGGAIGVALIGMLGGYAVSGVGTRRSRWAAGLLASLSTIAAAFYFAASRRVVTPRKVFGALLFVLLMAALAAGVGVAARPRPAR